MLILNLEKNNIYHAAICYLVLTLVALALNQSIYTRFLVRAVFIGAFFICAQFQNTPKDLVPADFTFYGSESPSFVRKRWVQVYIKYSKPETFGVQVCFGLQEAC